MSTLADINNNLEVVVKNTAATGTAVNKLLSKFSGGDQLEKQREAKQASVFKNLTSFARGGKARGKSGKGGLSGIADVFSGFTAAKFAGILGKSALRALPGILVTVLADEIVDTVLDGDKLNPETREMLIRSLEFGGLGMIFGRKFAAIGIAVGALSKELENPKYDPALKEIEDAIASLKLALFGGTVNVGPGGMYTEQRDGLLTGSIPFLLENFAEGITGVAKIITGDFLTSDWYEQLKKGNFEDIFDPEFEKVWPEALAVIGGMAILMGGGGAFMKTLRFLAGFGVGTPVGRILLAAAAGGAAAKFGFEKLVDYTRDIGLIDEATAEQVKDAGGGAALAVGTGATAYTAYRVGKKVAGGSAAPLADAAANTTKKLPDGISKKMMEEADRMGLKFNSANQLVDKTTGQYVKREIAEEFGERIAKKGLLKGATVLGAMAIPFIGWMIGAGVAAYEIYEFTQGRGLYYDIYKYLNTKDNEDILNDLTGRESKLTSQSGRNLKGAVAGTMSDLKLLSQQDPEMYGAIYDSYKNKYFGKGITGFDSAFSKLPAPSVVTPTTDDAYNSQMNGTGDVNIGQVGSNTSVQQVNPLALMDIGTGDGWNTNRRGLHSTSPAYP